jgi:hypothetical protein
MLSAMKDVIRFPLFPAHFMLDTLPVHTDGRPGKGPGTRRRSLWIAMMLALSVVVSACATAPQVGVRASYQGASVATIALVPFYALASFGLEDDALKELMRSYEEAATRWLSRRGFEVIDSRSFEHHLTELGVWHEFREGVLLREALTAYFEPTERGLATSIEVATLKRFAEQGLLPAPSLFFGELIYHSDGLCQNDPRRFTSYAQTQVTREAPGDYPRPCVTSHFQAKLVDASSGHTMWYNRMLLETHSDRVDSQLIESTIAAAVQQTLASPRGIDRLLPGGREAGSDAVVETGR